LPEVKISVKENMDCHACKQTRNDGCVAQRW